MSQSNDKHGIQASASVGPDTRVQADLPLPQGPVVPEQEALARRPGPFPYLATLCGMLLGAMIPIILVPGNYREFRQFPLRGDSSGGNPGNWQDFGFLTIGIRGMAPLYQEEWIDDLPHGRKMVWVWRLTTAIGGGIMGSWLFFYLARRDQGRAERQRQWKSLADEGYLR